MAQEVSPTQQCAEAAAGAEIEVCLRLAADHPEHVTGIAAALQAHVARAGVPERALLDALLALVDDDSAPDAAQQLAALGDPRALPSLTSCGERRSHAVRLACVEAMAAWSEALAPLTDWLSHPETPEALRIAAIEGLGRLGTDTAADVLVRTLETPGQSARLRAALRDGIARHYPERLDDIGDSVRVDGRPWLMLGGGAALGTALSAAGQLGKAELAAVGVVTGGITGATAGALYGRAFPMEAGDAAFITTSGLMGTAAGQLLLSPSGETAGVLGRLGGATLGYGTGVALHKVHPGTGRDSVEALGMTSALAVTSAGVTTLLRQTDSMEPVLGTTVALGGIGAHALSPHVDVTAEDRGLITFTTSLTTAGAVLWPAPRETTTGRVLVGLGTGPLVSWALAGPVDATAGVQTGAWAGMLHGGVFGGGVGLALGPETENLAAARTGALAGMLVGSGVGAWRTWADPEPIDPDDVVLVGIVGSWTAWQAAGWGIHGQASTRTTGILVATPAVASATAAVLASEVDVPVIESISSTSLGLWGIYAGGVGAQLAERPSLPGALIGGNVGLGVGALLVSPVVGVPPVVIGVADAGGALGGAAGVLVGALTTDDDAIVLGASLVGVGLGATGGALLGTRWVRSGSARDMALVRPRAGGTWSLAPLAIDVEGVRHHGLSLRVTGW